VPGAPPDQLSLAAPSIWLEGDTMQAIPARPRGTARLARVLGLDGNPLRRASDRAEAWIRIGVLVAFLVAGPLAAISAGQWVHDTGMHEARAQAARTHGVRAVLLQPVSPAVARRGSKAWARARLESPGVPPRTGRVLAPVGAASGSVVTVWLDGSGKLAAPPLEPGQVITQTVMVAALTPVLVTFALLAALGLTHLLLSRWRLAAWDAAWSTVGPRWTGRWP